MASAIVSVATQPEQRAAIVIHACEHGARAIYAEKTMAASLVQADAMVAAVERYGVAFNMGTNRRWETPYATMKELLHGGRYGRLLSMTIHQGAGLFNLGSHAFDLFLWLNDDRAVEWVQFHLTSGGDDLAGGWLRRDPNGGGRLQFANGVAAFATDSGRSFEVEVVLGGDSEFLLFLLREAGGVSHRGHPALPPGTFPPFTRSRHGRAVARQGAHRPHQPGTNLRQHPVAPPRRLPRGVAAGGQRPAPGARRHSPPAVLRALTRRVPSRCRNCGYIAAHGRCGAGMNREGRHRVAHDNQGENAATIMIRIPRPLAGRLRETS